MFMILTCKKCNGKTLFDVQDKTNEEINEFLAKVDFGHCQAGGWHVELGKMANYYTTDYKRYIDEETARSAMKKELN